MVGRPGTPGSFMRWDPQVWRGAPARFPSSALATSAPLPLAKARHVAQTEGVFSAASVRAWTYGLRFWMGGVAESRCKEFVVILHAVAVVRS